MLAIGFVDDPGIGTSTPLVQKFLKNACLGRTPYPDLVLLLKNSQAFSGLPTDLNPRFLLLKLVLQSYLLGPEAFRSCFLSLSIARRWAIAYTTRPASAGSSIPCGGTEGPRTAGPAARARARAERAPSNRRPSALAQSGSRTCQRFVPWWDEDGGTPVPSPFPGLEWGGICFM